MEIGTILGRALNSKMKKTGVSFEDNHESLLAFHSYTLDFSICQKHMLVIN